MTKHRASVPGQPKTFLRPTPTIDIAAEYQRALQLHRTGQLGQARAIYERILQIQPNHPGALYLLGTVALQGGGFADAERLLQRAAALQPTHVPTLINLALTLSERNRHAQALDIIEQARQIEPSSPVIRRNRATVLLKAERFEDALAQLQALLDAGEQDADLWLNHGVALLNLDHHAEAQSSLARALSLQPGNAKSLNNQVISLARSGDLAGSRDAALVALQAHPDYVPLRLSLGRTLLGLGQSEEALDCFAQAVQQAPHDPLAKCALADCRLRLNDSAGALEVANQALEHNPDCVQAYLVGGRALSQLGDFESALLNFERALTIDPDSAPARQLKIQALYDLGDYRSVVQQTAIDGSNAAPVDLDLGLSARMFLCDWTDFEAHRRSITQAIDEHRATFTTWPLLALLDDPRRHLQATKDYLASLQLPSPMAEQPIDPNGDRPIRIGYFSADFFDHATMYLMAQLLESHDTRRFEVHAYSYGLRIPSALMDDRIRPRLAHFHEVSNWSNQQIVEHARQSGIDIAVDLKGYTRLGRPELFALRCAPIQVSYLGYPGTTAMDTMDYVVADTIVIPPAKQQDYTEKVVYLPHSYQCNDNRRRIAERHFTRAELGLPEDGFVFCSFNANYKILPEVFVQWVRILQSVPGSVLWLYQSNELAANHLRQAAQALGLAPERLVFAQRLPLDEHLARLQLADLFLDTYPCNAHTTASDALWAGVPLITRAGESFASRVAASLLTALGLTELITNTPADYEALATSLALDGPRLANIRHALGERRLTSPLFDGVLFAHHLEQAFEAMVTRRHAGLAPAPIHVRP